MDEDFLAETLGFVIEDGEVVWSKTKTRQATIPERAMWWLLTHPLSEWHEADL